VPENPGIRNNPPVLQPLYPRAVTDAFLKLDPRQMIRNPVMFIVETGSALTTLLWFQALTGNGEAPAGFIGAISAWLWFTVLFANFAEALAEGRGKAQAESLRKMRQDTKAKKLFLGYEITKGREPGLSDYLEVSSSTLHKTDLFYVKAGDTIPVDGEVVEGIASVNESAITGESAPVIRESGGDRSAVTGGTVILSDWLIIQVSATAGEGFLDHMISLVEGAKRQKTPNEVALNILLIGLTAVFLVICMTLRAFSVYSVQAAGSGIPVTITVLVALLVCLAPTTIGGLLSAIGIAGMDRLIRRNVITTSGRAIEAAGDVDVLLLDKTGTITLGNRQAVDLIPVDGTDIRDLVETAQLASLADETPEGKREIRASRQDRRVNAIRYRHAVRTLLEPDPDERGRCRRYTDPKGGLRCHVQPYRGKRPYRVRCARKGSRDDLSGRRDPARCDEGRQGAWSRSSQGHRERRDEGAVCAAP
jgi:potassium-transporting ATPase ATP-binding subunit